MTKKKRVYIIIVINVVREKKTFVPYGTLSPLSAEPGITNNTKKKKKREDTTFSFYFILPDDYYNTVPFYYKDTRGEI